MPELKELYNSLINYNIATLESEWLNVSNATTLLFSVKSSKYCTIYCDFSKNSDYGIDYTETKTADADISTELMVIVRSRYVRFRVENYTVPVDITTQGFYFDMNILCGEMSNKEMPKMQISNIPTGVFGGVHTVEETAEIQYTFNRGTTGKINTKSYVIPYTDIKTYTNGVNYDLLIDTAYRLTGGLTNEKALLFGRSYSYQAGQGLIFKFTGVFYQTTKNGGGVNCTKQLVGIGNPTVGGDEPENFLGFGFYDSDSVYDPSNFGIVYINGGVSQFIKISNFNNLSGRDLALSTNWENINVFKITLAYLGAGNIRFYMMDKETSEYTLLHTLKLPGTITQANLSDPSLSLLLYQHAEAGKSDPVNGGDMVGVCSFNISQEGVFKMPYDRFSSNNTTTIVSGIETNILSLRNDTTFYGKRNNYSIEVDYLSVSSEGTKPVLFNIWRNKTITTPTYTQPYPNNIPVSKDTTGTLGAGGYLLFSTALSKSDNIQMSLDSLHTTLVYGDVITISALSSQNSEISVCLGYHIR